MKYSQKVVHVAAQALRKGTAMHKNPLLSRICKFAIKSVIEKIMSEVIIDRMILPKSERSSGSL